MCLRNNIIQQPLGNDNNTNTCIIRDTTKETNIGIRSCII